MYVSTFDEDLLTADASVAKFLKRISAVGRRASDVDFVLPKTLTHSTVGSHTERLLRYFAEIGENGRSFAYCFIAWGQYSCNMYWRFDSVDLNNVKFTYGSSIFVLVSGFICFGLM